MFPALTPLVFGVGRPFPYISNLSLSLLVVLRDPVQDAEVLARVKVPKELLRRYLPLGDGISFVALEDVISHNLEALFPGMEVVGTRSSGSPATPTTTSPTRPTTSARRSRTRSAAAASAR